MKIRLWLPGTLIVFLGIGGMIGATNNMPMQNEVKADYLWQDNLDLLQSTNFQNLQKQVLDNAINSLINKNGNLKSNSGKSFIDLHDLSKKLLKQVGIEPNGSFNSTMGEILDYYYRNPPKNLSMKENKKSAAEIVKLLIKEGKPVILPSDVKLASGSFAINGDKSLNVLLYSGNGILFKSPDEVTFRLGNGATSMLGILGNGTWNGKFMVPKVLDKSNVINSNSTYSGKQLDSSKVFKVIKIGVDGNGLSMILNRNIQIGVPAVLNNPLYKVVTSVDGIQWSDINNSNFTFTGGYYTFYVNKLAYFAIIESGLGTGSNSGTGSNNGSGDTNGGNTGGSTGTGSNNGTGSNSNTGSNNTGGTYTGGNNYTGGTVGTGTNTGSNVGTGVSTGSNMGTGSTASTGSNMGSGSYTTGSTVNTGSNNGSNNTGSSNSSNGGNNNSGGSGGGTVSQSTNSSSNSMGGGGGGNIAMNYNYTNPQSTTLSISSGALSSVTNKNSTNFNVRTLLNRNKNPEFQQKVSKFIEIVDQKYPSNQNRISIYEKLVQILDGMKITEGAKLEKALILKDRLNEKLSILKGSNGLSQATLASTSDNENSTVQSDTSKPIVHISPKNKVYIITQMNGKYVFKRSNGTYSEQKFDNSEDAINYINTNDR